MSSMIPADKAFTKYIEKYQNLNFKIYMLSFLLLYCWKQNVNKNDFETFFSGTSQFFFKCHFLYLFCLYNAAFLNFMQKNDILAGSIDLKYDFWTTRKVYKLFQNLWDFLKKRYWTFISCTHLYYFFPVF